MGPLLYQTRGAMEASGVTFQLFGKKIDYFGPFWATWPFAKLECYREFVIVKVWPWSVQISIPVKEIDVVEYRRLKLWRPLRRPSLKFLHHAPVANPVTFLAFSLDHAVKVLRELGVKVTDK